MAVCSVVVGGKSKGAIPPVRDGGAGPAASIGNNSDGVV
jgi:hypothetical protein